MLFSHSPALRQAFPELVAGVVRADGIHAGADVSAALARHTARALAQIWEEVLGVQLHQLAASMEDLTMSLQEIDRFMLFGDVVLVSLADPKSNYDYTKFLADIETTTKMQVLILFCTTKMQVLILSFFLYH